MEKEIIFVRVKHKIIVVILSLNSQMPLFFIKIISNYKIFMKNSGICEFSDKIMCMILESERGL
jgi:hypothetical protein